jgi:hypothetical protein
MTIILRLSAIVALPCMIVTAQAVSPNQPPSSGVDLAGDSTVIRVEYNCGDAPAPCTLTVTKGEFEGLVNALDPTMSAPNRQALAADYSRLLIMAAEARRRGIDRSPELQTLIHYSTLQVLASRLVYQMNAAAPAISAEDIEKYFANHATDYQEVVLSRIFVPAHPNHNGDGYSEAEAAAQAARLRILNGEEFSRVATELSSSSGPINSPLGPVRCASLPEGVRPVCSLTQWEVSSPVKDAGGYSIYRLDSRTVKELADVREEVRQTIERERLQHELESARTPVSLDLNEQYFGHLPTPELAHKHGMALPNTSSGDPHQSHTHHHQ